MVEAVPRLSLWRPRFDHRLVLMAFVLDEVAVGQIVLQSVFSFILSVSLHQYLIFHSSTIITIHS